MSDMVSPEGAAALSKLVRAVGKEIGNSDVVTEAVLRKYQQQVRAMRQKFTYPPDIEADLDNFLQDLKNRVNQA
jgi:hypothetical protein